LPNLKYHASATRLRMQRASFFATSADLTQVLIEEFVFFLRFSLPGALSALIAGPFRVIFYHMRTMILWPIA
jgi:hypothetical protein